ncbi:MAG: molybdopterin-dependent oxidoreductase [Candidatus Bipolaricaulota bacterium]|nr:MAG: molybdopterin-dependent oxidoreductase [Candidatus Bipolaricaulota bacterium]
MPRDDDVRMQANDRKQPRTRHVRRTLTGLAVAVLAGAVAFTLYPEGDGDATHDGIEIREYQGTRLGSVDDFRENSIAGVQTIDIETYRLVVDGLVGQTASWTYAELQALEHTTKLITIHCVEGWSVTALWEGIRVGELLDVAVPLPAATTVIFHAADGYTSSLPLAELRRRDLILADRINGIVLPPANGFPFQLVAEDKWGYKWVRWVTRIELSADNEYRGFWERRGYNNDGDIDGPIREGS